jgi:hypothetical protein
LNSRKLIAFLLVVCGIVVLLAALLSRPRCPVELRVLAVGPSGIVDDSGKESSLVALSVSNIDCVAIMFDRNGDGEAEVEGRWITVEPSVNLDRIAAGRGMEESLIVPAGARTLRLRLRYQSETWKSRLMIRLGPNGRMWVAKSSLLCRLVWPDQYKTMPFPPRWKLVTLKVSVPNNEQRPATHNQRR